MTEKLLCEIYEAANATAWAMYCAGKSTLAEYLAQEKSAWSTYRSVLKQRDRNMLDPLTPTQQTATLVTKEATSHE